MLLHSLLAAAWPANDSAAPVPSAPLPLLGLLDQQFHVCQPAPAAEKTGRLFACARAQPSQGTLALSLRGRPGQPAREVALHLSWSPPLAQRALQRPGAPRARARRWPRRSCACGVRGRMARRDWNGCC